MNKDVLQSFMYGQELQPRQCPSGGRGGGWGGYRECDRGTAQNATQQLETTNQRKQRSMTRSFIYSFI